MAKVHSGEEIIIAESFNPVSRAPERYRRQTGGFATAKTRTERNVSHSGNKTTNEYVSR